MDKRNILLLGAGKDQLIGIKHCLELGFGVFAIDGRENAEGFKFCDKHETCDIRNPDEVEKIAKKWNKEDGGIDGVISLAVEVGISVGRVVDCLGLIGIGEKTAKTMTDKIHRRYALDEAKIPQPAWCYREEKKMGLWKTFPCIAKPRDQAGAVGVRYCESMSEIGPNYDYLEEFLEGWELSVEVLFFDNDYRFAVADRHYDKKMKWKPYLLEDGCTFPSKIPSRIEDKIQILIRKLRDLFQLKDCVMKLDLLVKDNIVYVIECAPRLGGGKLSSKMIPMASGVNWWKIATKIAMGEEISDQDLLSTEDIYVSQRYAFPENPTSHKDRLFSVEATGTTYEEAQKNAEDLLDRTRSA